MGVRPPTTDSADMCVEAHITTASGRSSDADTSQGSANVVTKPTPGASGIRKCQKRKYNDDNM
ncbi:hypothetical protein SK128_002702, partial [Halocaridina rubra]